jgi:3-oxoadipate enol-lactonase
MPVDHVNGVELYGNHDGIAPARNSTAIASRIRGAELRGYEGGHLFLFQDPAALGEFEAFLQAPSRPRGSD